MGGRGASLGGTYVWRGRTYEYGDEYKSALKHNPPGNIKFIVKKEGATTAPMETRTKGRIYVTVDNTRDLKYITFYDKNNKRYKQIDLKGKLHMVDGKKILPHVHHGYVHDENGTTTPSKADKKIIDLVYKIWDNELKKQAIS